MKITGSTTPASKPLTGSGTARTQSGGGAGRTSAAPSATSAGTGSSLSGAENSSQLSQLEAQFSQADFNASKVSEITSAIASGQYQVNTGVIADKLIQSTLALGRSATAS